MAAKKPVTVFDAAHAWIERQIIDLSPLVSRLGSRRAERIALGAAFLIYFIAQVYLSAGPAILRPTPIEADDTYSYIIEPALIRAGCFPSDCRALDSLHDQLASPSDNIDTASIRHREYHRIFYFYHPLHSFFLYGLKSAGLSWEQAYDAVWIAGKVFLTLAVAYWTVTIWGPPAGTIALLFLGPTVFQGQGLHAIVPSNLALAVALILLAEVYRKRDRINWHFVPLILVLILLHPIGRLYAVLILAFAFLDSPWPIKRYSAINVGLALFIVAASFIVPELVSHPELSFNPVEFYPGSWDYLGALKESLPRTGEVLQNWARHWDGFAFVIPFALLGLVSYRGKSKRLFLMLGLLAGLAIAGIFYVVPFYGALGFERAWVILAIFLIGAISQGYATLMALITSKKPARLEKQNQYLKRKWLITFSVVLGLFLAIYFVQYTMSQARNYQATFDSMAYSGESAFNPDQPGMLESLSDANDGVVYMDELSLYYYVTYGPLDVEAIYYPAVAGSPEEADWILNDPEGIDFIVARNPVYRAPHTAMGAIVLDLQDTLDINGTAPINLGALQLFVNARANSIDIILSMINGETREDTKVTLPAGPAGWVSLGTELPIVTRAILWLRPTAAPIQVAGLRFSENALTNWPWDKGISLILRSAEGEETEINFDPQALIQQLPFQLQIIDDKGASVLARVVD